MASRGESLAAQESSSERYKQELVEKDKSSPEVTEKIADTQRDILDKLSNLPEHVLPKIDRDRFHKELKAREKNLSLLEGLQEDLNDIQREYMRVKAEIARISPDIIKRHGDKFWAMSIEQRRSEIKTLWKRDGLRKQYVEKFDNSDVFKTKKKVIKEFMDWFDLQSVMDQEKAISDFGKEEEPRKELQDMGKRLIMVLPSSIAKDLEKELNADNVGRSEMIAAYQALDEKLDKEFRKSMDDIPSDKFTDKAKSYAEKYWSSLYKPNKYGVNSMLEDKAKNIDFAKKAIEKEQKLNGQFAKFEKINPRFFNLKEKGWEKLNLDLRENVVETGQVYNDVTKDYEQAKKDGLMSAKTFEKYMAWLDSQTDSVDDVKKAREGWSNEKAQLQEIYDKFELIKVFDPKFYNKNKSEFMDGRRSDRLKILDKYEKESASSLDKDPVELNDKQVKIGVARKHEEKKRYDEAIEEWQNLSEKYPQDKKTYDKEIDRIKELMKDKKGSGTQSAEMTDDNLELDKAAEKAIENNTGLKKKIDILELKQIFFDFSEQNERGLGQSGEIKGARKRALKRAERDKDEVAEAVLEDQEMKDKKIIVNKEGHTEKMVDIDLGNEAAWNDNERVAGLRRIVELKKEKRFEGQGGLSNVNLTSKTEGRDLTGREAKERIANKAFLLMQSTMEATAAMLGKNTKSMNEHQKAKIMKAAMKATKKKSKYKDEDLWKMAA